MADKEPIDGNEAVARSAYALSEVAAIYPITPASNMGEWFDDWASKGHKNIWGTVPIVSELQSEAGAAGAAHGAVSVGALGATFTASQGLLLKVPVMYKVAGELTPMVLHVAARSVATHALSIFGDHSDVMCTRGTGFALLSSGSVQEAHDLAAIAHLATFETRIPFLHFFDGFRTSHEVHKIELLSQDDFKALVDDEAIRQHRARGLNPEHPTLKGSAQNPDVFFQAREACNPWYDACAAKTQAVMDKFAKRVGRAYHLFDYYGHKDADRVVILMGSGIGAVEEAVDALNAKGEKVGVLKVRLYRPFDARAFLKALPVSAKNIAVLDRCKEPGANSEPLFSDVATVLQEAFSSGELKAMPRLLCGRYGLSSKEFAPSMAAAVFAELQKPEPKTRFTIGINDDVTKLSLSYDPAFSTEDAKTTRAVFFGLGADGTVGANKNSIKIIADETDMHAQGYFVYDSKKSGSMTISHLRFGSKPIRSTYLVREAQFVACHSEPLMSRVDVLGLAAPGATFLLNTTTPDKAFDSLPLEAQQAILSKKLKFYAIDAYSVAKDAGLGPRINTVMQVCFFEITKLLPGYMDLIKKTIQKTYGSKSQEIVSKNFKAVENTLKNLREVKVPAKPTATRTRVVELPKEAPEFIHKVTKAIMIGRGDDLPVSSMPADGAFPTATTQWEKRAIALDVPAWDSSTCIQCAKCSFVCPHASIRPKAYPADALKSAPTTFKSVDYRAKDFGPNTKFTIQVAAEDCTGCGLCVEACPAKNKQDAKRKAINMTPFTGELQAAEKENFAFFMSLPEADRTKFDPFTVKGSQLCRPLFEFSGACGGCGETPYIKLATQLFGERMIVANATGCSSIYGGNLPTTPYSQNKDGRGPAWSNSLFEDNAEFGLGFRLALDAQRARALELLRKMKGALGSLADDLANADQKDDAGILAQRRRVDELKKKLAPASDADSKNLLSLADSLLRKSVWIIGGDGWAYDIGYGGLDHVVRSGMNVKLLVLDTEVYSNTGGQQSKATPRGAVARFAAAGKRLPRKDFAMLAASYGNVYVARVAFGSSDAQTVKAFKEAEAYEGPALIIAYSHCIAHGINLSKGLEQQKLAVESGYWPLFRYNPSRIAEGKNPMELDSKAPKIPLQDYIYRETRYRMLTASKPEVAKQLLAEAQKEVEEKWRLLEHLSKLDYSSAKPQTPAEPPQTATAA
ncbi:MAG TPA: pyruvate:ferredoxin (flavodoxin) oxidoreductase [Elusimicrobia bacterium]|nr:pyruvate:ferredoxin (flavodoxin) oxidoreductase [Elusimicrobiota bacterium]